MLEAHNPDLPLILDLWIGAHPAEVRRAVGHARRALCAVGFDPRRADEAELLLAEALNNVVEHAYADQAAGRIHLQILADGRTALLRLCDTGAGMPCGVPPDGRPRVSVDPDDLPEGGYGWHLIHQLADTVRYDRRGGRNRLELRLAGRAGRGGTNPRGCS
ncbi:ATP-binding protein [Salipiger sp.]|uniref:ATP-binding protein n=1 Tax=Salipiger sp. TaxID=2078585 RepID=UPI003A9722CB